jgi:hypothetical protein
LANVSKREEHARADDAERGVEEGEIVGERGEALAGEGGRAEDLRGYRRLETAFSQPDHDLCSVDRGGVGHVEQIRHPALVDVDLEERAVVEHRVLHAERADLAGRSRGDGAIGSQGAVDPPSASQEGHGLDQDGPAQRPGELEAASRERGHAGEAAAVRGHRERAVAALLEGSGSAEDAVIATGGGLVEGERAIHPDVEVSRQAGGVALQRPLGDRRPAGVGVRTREDDGSIAELLERAGAADDATEGVLDAAHELGEDEDRIVVQRHGAADGKVQWADSEGSRVDDGPSAVAVRADEAQRAGAFLRHRSAAADVSTEEVRDGDRVLREDELRAVAHDHGAAVREVGEAHVEGALADGRPPRVVVGAAEGELARAQLLEGAGPAEVVGVDTGRRQVEGRLGIHGDGEVEAGDGDAADGRRARAHLEDREAAAVAHREVGGGGSIDVQIAVDVGEGAPERDRAVGGHREVDDVRVHVPVGGVDRLPQGAVGVAGPVIGVRGGGDGERVRRGRASRQQQNEKARAAPGANGPPLLRRKSKGGTHEQSIFSCRGGGVTAVRSTPQRGRTSTPLELRGALLAHRGDALVDVLGFEAVGLDLYPDALNSTHTKAGSTGRRSRVSATSEK